MTAPRRGPIVREAIDDDGTALASFECSTGPWYEEEVQAYIRGRALTLARENPDGYRLLVAFEQTHLIAVAAHASEALILPEDNTYMAARLQVLAIGGADQRRRLPDRSRRVYRFDPARNTYARTRARSLSSSVRQVGGEFSEQPPLWLAC